MPLFDGANDPRVDLETLVTATRDALASPSFDVRFQALFELVSDGMAWRMVRHLRAKRLPPMALVLAGGAAGIGIGKAYAVRPAWNASHALLRGRPPYREVRALPALEAEIDELQAKMKNEDDASAFVDAEDRLAVACAERWVAELLAKRAAEENLGMRASMEFRLEDARWDLSETLGRGSRTAPDPALARVALRTAPIGAGDSSVSLCSDDRAMLHDSRRAGPAWEGLLLAIDACGGGSHAALEGLDRFARAHEALVWPLWLDEVACALADHPRRGEVARRLDAVLAADAGALDLVGFYRERLEANVVEARDVWLTLAARREPGFEPHDELLRTIAEERARLDAGQPGRLDPRYFRMVERTLEDSMRETRLEQERAGPFYDLRIDPPLERAFDGPLFYLFAGFRSLYGAELAREALGALAN